MFVSAVIAGGAPRRVLELASDGVIRIVASPKLLARSPGMTDVERLIKLTEQITVMDEDEAEPG